MIEAGTHEYKTVDGRTVIMLPQTRMIKGKKVHVGIIAGEKSYRHWTTDGQLFGEKDQGANLNDYTG